jgi:hypothetical protein
MPEDKSPLEQALDLFVYAPLGLAITAREELPKLVDKGRQRVSGQVTMARMMGQFAVAQGQKEAEKAVKQAAERLGGRSRGPGPSATPSTGPSTRPAPARAASAPKTPPAPAGATATATSTSSSAASAASTNGGGVPPADSLAIPGYDALSASQVVQRLAGLSGDELAQVGRYESATRHRKTILTRITQLQS